MASIHLAGIDMNDADNLALYSQILLFKNDLSQESLSFNNRSTSAQRVMQAIAHSLSLEYEYSVLLRTIRISRPFTPQIPAEEVLDDLILDDLHPSNFEMAEEMSAFDFLDFDPELGFCQRASDIAKNDVLGDPNDRALESLLSYKNALETQCALSNSIWLRDCHQTDMTANKSNDSVFGEEPTYSPKFIPYDQPEYMFPSSPPPAVYNQYQGESPYGSRKGSVHSAASSGYREMVFDSKSMHSSQGSIASNASGRRGPLSDLARAGMNAVKKVGACWRCKVLRKPCNPQDPCTFCPKGKRSDWELVGCNRGRFGSKSLSIGFCPGKEPGHNDDWNLNEWIDPNDRTLVDCIFCANRGKKCDGSSFMCENANYSPVIKKYIQIERLNMLMQQLGNERDEWVAKQRELYERTTPSSTTAALSIAILETISKFCCSLPSRPSSAALDPLKDCILAISWELEKIRDCCSPTHCGHPIHQNRCFDNEGVIERILPLAAVYQGRVETDRLIAQSLVCLRSCLEVLRAQQDQDYPELHTWCLIGACQIDYIESLSKSLTAYTDELWRVIFKKENLRSREGWWLSAFYSLCIQSTVRKALLIIFRSGPCSRYGYADRLRTGSKQYLYLPLRLFIASSGRADPLEGTQMEMSCHGKDYQEARTAVRQMDWASQNITGSADYLRKLFEDDGEALQSNQAWQSTPDSLKRRRESSEDIHPSLATSKRTLQSFDSTARDHPLYQNARPQADGLYHCPWEKETNSTCQHKPEKLKCNYDKFVDSHLKPYRCKVVACKDPCFSSTACLLRHEREAHSMHAHRDKPFLCTYEGCERGAPGNGFPRHWNLRDHLKRVHNHNEL